MTRKKLSKYCPHANGGKNVLQSNSIEHYLNEEYYYPVMSTCTERYVRAGSRIL
jgi:hypothetical protein